MVNMFQSFLVCLCGANCKSSESDHMLTWRYLKSHHHLQEILSSSPGAKIDELRCALGYHCGEGCQQGTSPLSDTGQVHVSYVLLYAASLSCSLKPFPQLFHIIIIVPWHIALSEEIGKWWRDTIIWERFKMDCHLPIDICITLDSDGVIWWTWWTIAGECFWKGA